MNRRFIFTIVIFASIFVFAMLAIVSFHFRDDIHFRVLVVHSFPATYKPYADYSHDIISEFKTENINPDIRYVYSKSSTFGYEEDLKQMYCSIDSVITGGWKPDVVIVNDDQATSLLLKCNHPLIHRVPIVFSGVGFPDWSIIRQYDNVTGVQDKMDLNANMDFVKEIMGENTSFYVAIDSTSLDQKIRKEIQAQLKNKKVVGNCTTPNMPYPQQYDLLQKGYTLFSSFSVCYGIDNQRVFILWPSVPLYNTRAHPQLFSLDEYHKNMAYFDIKKDFSSDLLNKVCAIPYFSLSNKDFGYSGQSIGGYFTSMETQLRESVHLASLILHGQNVKDIPIKNSSKEYWVDWDALARYRINPDLIPSKCHIINAPFRVTHPWLWLLSWLLGLSVFVAALVLYRLEHKKKLDLFKELKKERDLLSLSFDGSNAFAWSFDGCQFTFDSSFWKYMNMSPKPITKEEMLSHIHPDYKREYQDISTEILKNPRGKIQLLFSFFGKNYDWWESRFFALRKLDGTICAHGLAININEIKAHEAKLERLRQQSEKAELKQSFIENINHEIRTPLNAIVGFSDVLANDEQLTNEERHHFANIVNRNNKLLLEMFDDIIMLSQLESGQNKLSLRPCLVREVVNDIYAQFGKKIHNDVNYSLDEDNSLSNLTFQVDRDYFSKVIFHLLGNSLKFTNEGYIKLGYRYFPDDSSVSIYVEDSGIGMDEKDIENIFNRFYKNSHLSQGTGLGLTICKTIVEMLHGSIEVYSTLGKGSCFAVNMPCVVNNKDIE